MPGKRKILSVAIGSLLLIPVGQTAQAAKSLWECRTGADGKWECYKGGVLVPQEATPDKSQPNPKAPEPKAVPVPTSSPEASVATPGKIESEPAVDPESETQSEPVPDTEERTPEAPLPEPEPVAESASEASVATPEAIEPEAAVAPKPESRVVEAPVEEPVSTPPRQAPEVPESREVEAVLVPPSQPAPEPETPSEPLSSPEGKAAEPPAETAAEREVVAEPAALFMPTAPEEKTLARLDRGLEWGRCGPLRSRGAVRLDSLSQEGPVRIRADSAVASRPDQVAHFSGDVEVIQGQQQVSADDVRYRRGEDNLQASGSVYYQQPGIRVAASSAEIQLQREQARLENVEYRLPERMARGGAARVEMLGKGEARLEEVSYTTCSPGREDWLLQAGMLDLDQVEGWGVAEDARLSLGGVPVFYFPRVSFPIDDRRKTGFLVPSVGQSDETGFEVAAPYYLNLAPNYDATLVPRVMSKRGLMLGGEFRYLAENHSLRLAGEILPHDDERTQGRNETRGFASLQEQGRLMPRLLLDVDATYVSDRDYWDDFGGSLSVTASRHAMRRADLTYYGSFWSLLGRVEDHQTLDRGIAPGSEPYSRLPQVLLQLEYPGGPAGLTYNLRSEYVRFGRDSGVTGSRFDLNPALSLPLRRSWGYLIPKAGGRYTDYRLDNRTAGLPENPSRSLATGSLDGGLVFERSLAWFDGGAVQTLEPRFFYLWVQEKDQSLLPVFDSSEIDFSFDNLFRENRFNGADRIGDANQLTLALSSRTLDDESGKELLRASLGQIYYFDDRRVQLPGTAIQSDESSALVGEVAAHLARYWDIRGSAQWNPHRERARTEKGAVGLHYRDESRRIFNLAYRYSRNLVEQTDASFRWPLSARLQGVARWNYSIRHSTTMEAFGGIEYESCCWAVRFVARRYVNDVLNDPNTGFYLQFELKGLSRFGSDIESLLDRGILGYDEDNRGSF